ncbi:hypothetical protein ACFZCP_05425 [Streptomyces sp. NPDC007971]|uniref:hypothetical protein n=1 Tax=Streptomyces sp. NPDC007971 TaxID=3364799 RepID=UPI0036E97E8B
MVPAGSAGSGLFGSFGSFGRFQPVPAGAGSFGWFRLVRRSAVRKVHRAADWKTIRDAAGFFVRGGRRRTRVGFFTDP